MYFIRKIQELYLPASYIIRAEDPVIFFRSLKFRQNLDSCWDRAATDSRSDSSVTCIINEPLWPADTFYLSTGPLRLSLITKWVHLNLGRKESWPFFLGLLTVVLQRWFKQWPLLLPPDSDSRSQKQFQAALCTYSMWIREKVLILFHCFFLSLEFAFSLCPKERHGIISQQACVPKGLPSSWEQSGVERHCSRHKGTASKRVKWNNPPSTSVNVCHCFRYSLYSYILDCLEIISKLVGLTTFLL